MNVSEEIIYGQRLARFRNAQMEYFKYQARWGLTYHVERFWTCTYEHVGLYVQLPSEIDPGFFREIPWLLYSDGIIRPDVVAGPATAESSLNITRWRLKDRNKANHWLATHLLQTPPVFY